MLPQDLQKVNDQFWKLYAQDIIKATEYFYAFSKESNYIKTREIAKNIEYKHQTEYGEIEITINLSKPEKDPKNIAAAKIEKLNYPVNMLCMENEGYAGNKTHPGRSNHRIIRMDVSGELWGSSILLILIIMNMQFFYQKHIVQ